MEHVFDWLIKDDAQVPSAIYSRDKMRELGFRSDELEKWERIWGRRLRPNLLVVQDGMNDTSIERFFRIDELDIVARKTEFFPTDYIALAECAGGNLLVTESASPGRILFWDHEDPNRPSSLASDLEALFDLLRTPEPDTADVISVWVHPSMQKYIKKKP